MAGFNREESSYCGHKSLLAHNDENTDEVKSSPDEGGDAVRTGDASEDDWSRERTRARVVAGLKEMVVTLVEVGDFAGAQEVAACLRSVATELPSQEPPLHPLGSELKA